ncbi:hypothetical protein V8F20_002484 [Naviculisporaceae sp. PSN 640]
MRLKNILTQEPRAHANRNEDPNTGSLSVTTHSRLMVPTCWEKNRVVRCKTASDCPNHDVYMFKLPESRERPRDQKSFHGRLVSLVQTGADSSRKMAWEYHGNATTIILAIALTLAFGWVPILIVVSLVQHGKRRWAAPPPDQEKVVAQHQKQPELPQPPPIVPQPLERTASNRSSRSYEPIRRWDTGSSWDPVSRRWDAESTAEPLARNNSVRSTFPRGSVPAMPMPSRASSVRSISSLHPGSASVGARNNRRGSISSIVSGPPGGSYKVDKAYYDTTPLPELPLPIAHSSKLPISQATNLKTPMSSSSRPHSIASSSQSRPGSSDTVRPLDFSRKRPLSTFEGSIAMSRHVSPPRRGPVNVQTVQPNQDEQPWWESPTHTHAM